MIFYWGLFSLIFFVLRRYEKLQIKKLGLEKIIRDELLKDMEIMTTEPEQPALPSARMKSSSSKVLKKKV